MRYDVNYFSHETNATEQMVVDGGDLPVEQVVDAFELLGNTVFTVASVPSGVVVHRSACTMADVVDMADCYV